MDKKQIVKQFLHRTSNPTSGDKRFQAALKVCTVSLLLTGFMSIVSIQNPDALFWDVAVWVVMGVILVVGSAAIVWRVWDIVKYNEVNEHGEEAPN